MPDVTFAYDKRLIMEGRFPFDMKPSSVREELKLVIAEEMNCRDTDGRMIIHVPKQITFVSFAPLPDHGEKLVVMQVFAYNWPDRMRNIDERLRKIGETVQTMFELAPGEADVSFVELRHPTIEQPPTWVNV